MFCPLLGIVSMGEVPICLHTSGTFQALFVASFLMFHPVDSFFDGDFEESAISLFAVWADSKALASVMLLDVL